MAPMNGRCTVAVTALLKMHSASGLAVGYTGSEPDAAASSLLERSGRTTGAHRMQSLLWKQFKTLCHDSHFAEIAGFDSMIVWQVMVSW